LTQRCKETQLVGRSLKKEKGHAEPQLLENGKKKRGHLRLNLLLFIFLEVKQPLSLPEVIPSRPSSPTSPSPTTPSSKTLPALKTLPLKETKPDPVPDLMEK